jgi:outer membrane protein assembly factor BamD
MSINNRFFSRFRFIKTSLLSFLCLGLVIIWIGTITGCSKGRKGEIPSPSESLHQAIAKYNHEDYLDAQEDFSAITLNYPGSVVIDSAEFYLGETHFAMKEYILAADSYQRVINQYSRSALVPLSQFKIGLCYFRLSPSYALDQEYTKKAVDEFQKFLEDYPDNEHRKEAETCIHKCRLKLAKKGYTAGILYYKMAEYNSAVIYFDDILSNYYDTEYAPLALYYKAESLQKSHHPQEAKEAYTTFLTKYPTHSYKSRVESRLKSLESSTTSETSQHG